jgi:S1-C subfamily serine protease
LATFWRSGGQAQPRAEREQSLGSGVILTPDGTILTNNHVIDGASDIKVQLSDKREFQAKLVGTDPKTDVAVLQINASGLPTLPLGDSTTLHVGDILFAIGDPFESAKHNDESSAPRDAADWASRTMRTSSRPTLRSTPEIRVAR